MSTVGKTIRCRAAVAWKPNHLRIENILVAPPRADEVRLKVVANTWCHTDVYTLQGDDPEGLFPCILGHEAGAIVESVGENVKDLTVGDHIIPCYQPQCGEKDCIFCKRPGINLCPKIRESQGAGLMSDGSSRFSTEDGKLIHHFMGCSTFSEYTVINGISAAKIDKNADLVEMSLLGCGVSTGWGAVWNTTKVTPDSSVAVFGLGAVGLSVIQAAKKVVLRPYLQSIQIAQKKAFAEEFGATDFINPDELNGKTIQEELIERTKWGVEFTYDCTGNVEVMNAALESAHRGWGTSCVVGVAKSGEKISTRPFQLITGRKWVGTAFGGWKSRRDVPKLVNLCCAPEKEGGINLKKYITHQYTGIDKVPEALEAMRSRDCLRAVVKY